MWCIVPAYVYREESLAQSSVWLDSTYEGRRTWAGQPDRLSIQEVAGGVAGQLSHSISARCCCCCSRWRWWWWWWRGRGWLFCEFNLWYVLFSTLEWEQNWQMAHSLWQAPRPGTSYRLISGTLHQELCFYWISKLVCTVDILTELWVFKLFRLVVYRHCIVPYLVVVGLYLAPLYYGWGAL